MTVREMVKAAGELDHLAVQFLNECVTNARRKKKCTAITFETDAMTPDDLMWLACDEGQRGKRARPQFVGVVVWIPIDDYERFEAAGGCAPRPQQGDKMKDKYFRVESGTMRRKVWARTPMQAILKARSWCNWRALGLLTRVQQRFADQGEWGPWLYVATDPKMRRIPNDQARFVNTR